MGVEITTWAKAITDRLNEKVKHVYDMVDQKLEYQHKYIEQRVDSLQSSQAEKLLSFSVRLEEALAEIRGYKDILQQQLTVTDGATKRAHERLDNLSEASKERYLSIEHSLSKVEESLGQLATDSEKKFVAFEELLKLSQESIDALEQNELIESTQKQAIKEDPVRKFLNENAQKILLIVISGIGIYIFRNLGAILQQISQ